MKKINYLAVDVYCCAVGSTVWIIILVFVLFAVDSHVQTVDVTVHSVQCSGSRCCAVGFTVSTVYSIANLYCL